MSKIEFHEAALTGAEESNQSYSCAIQTLINNKNVRVKIADLGNACYDVSFLLLSRIQLAPF